MQHQLDFISSADPESSVCFGWEAPLGYWGELRKRGQSEPVVTFNACEAHYRTDSPLFDLLYWLVTVGAFSGSALEEALAAWRSPERVRLSREAKRVLRLIAALRAEADW